MVIRILSLSASLSLLYTFPQFDETGQCRPSEHRPEQDADDDPPGAVSEAGKRRRLRLGEAVAEEDQNDPGRQPENLIYDKFVMFVWLLLVSVFFDHLRAIWPFFSNLGPYGTLALFRFAILDALSLVPLEQKGIDDYLAANGPDAVLQLLSKATLITKKKPGTVAVLGEIPVWKSSLIVNETGAPRVILANAITALREAPEWDGVLGFNEFTLCTTRLK